MQKLGTNRIAATLGKYIPFFLMPLPPRPQCHILPLSAPPLPLIFPDECYSPHNNTLPVCPVCESPPPFWQVDEQPLSDAESDASHPSAPFLLLSDPAPMSLKRRVGGCFCLLLLGVPPLLVGVHVAAFYPAMRDVVFLRFFMGGIYLCLLPTFFCLMVAEARASQLGTILAAEQVEVDGVAEFLGRRSAEDAPVIEFMVRTCVSGSCL